MGWMLMMPARAILIEQREKLGLTQEQVAAKAGIKLEQYQRYESHESAFSNTSLRIANAVLTVLELDPTDFSKGKYSLEPIDENDPHFKILTQYKG